MQREVTSEDFRTHFAEFGEVEDAVIVADQNGVSRGFGFVTYTDSKAIEKALIVKHVFGERTVDCKRAVPKEELRNQARARLLLRGGVPRCVCVCVGAGGAGQGIFACMLVRRCALLRTQPESHVYHGTGHVR
jgi:RNA recognition motif-containing protein